MRIPKTAVIGAESFIGKNLLNEYRKYHSGSLGTSRFRNRDEFEWLDLLAPNAEPLHLVERGYEAAIICAAVTKHRICTEQKKITRRINVTGILKLFHSLSDQGILPIILSSDSVFDGVHPKSYSEEDPVNPITEYGRQKTAVENEIINSGNQYLILRLSKVFGLDRDDGTFLTQTCESLLNGEAVFGAYDLIFNPIWIADVIKAIIAVQAHQLRGLFHICSPETYSRYDLVLTLARKLGCDLSLVRKISIDDLPGPKLPKNVNMSCDKVIRETGISFTPLNVLLSRMEKIYKN